MVRAVEQFHPRQVLHLGDCVRDAQALERQFPQLPVTMVPGNCDWGQTGEPERLLEIEGVRILMMHGHTRHVKSSPMAAVYAAREYGADVLLFGHTHQPLTDYEDGLYLMNPGSLGYGGTYGYVDITPAGIVTNLALDLPRRPGGDR